MPTETTGLTAHAALLNTQPNGLHFDTRNMVIEEDAINEHVWRTTARDTGAWIRTYFDVVEPEAPKVVKKDVSNFKAFLEDKGLL